MRKLIFDTEESEEVTPAADHKSCSVFPIADGGAINCYEILDGFRIFYYATPSIDLAELVSRTPADLFLHYCYIGKDGCADDGTVRIPITNGDYIIEDKFTRKKHTVTAEGVYTGVTLALDIDKLNAYFAEFFADEAFDCFLRKPYISSDGKFLSKETENLISHALAMFCQGYAATDFKYIKISTILVFSKLHDINRTAAPEEAPHYLQKYRVNTIRAVKAYLHAHMDRQITLSELSDLHRISISSLKSDFKIVCGMPVYAYLKKIRMEEAEHLLSTTDLSITEIASKVGYCNASKFSSAFKAHFDMSPSVARRSLGV